ncbi:hypothetical protein HMPREF3192_00732 [Atopobium deltae]|uniref:Uncharacterized protein n=1 Tax=Atopobium deltae TaxID=1393034 RepID=A0A133XV69_9ACTN|nr:hypothetical protein HMPREF3192_00732 [Atopobium deltae]
MATDTDASVVNTAHDAANVEVDTIVVKASAEKRSAGCIVLHTPRFLSYSSAFI